MMHALNIARSAKPPRLAVLPTEIRVRESNCHERLAPHCRPGCADSGCYVVLDCSNVAEVMPSNSAGVPGGSENRQLPHSYIGAFRQASGQGQ